MENVKGSICLVGFFTKSVFCYSAGDRKVVFLCHGESPVPGHALAGQGAEFLLVLILKL